MSEGTSFRSGPGKPAVAPRAKRMSLEAITDGVRQEPWAILVYGPEGVGKSTLAVSVADSVTLDVEQSANRLSTKKFPIPTSLQEVHEAIEVLLTQPHPYKRLVIDTIDRVEALIFAEVARAAGKRSIEDFAFKAGYQIALDEWRRLFARLDELRSQRRMDILLLAHAHIRPFRNPDGPDYDRYTLRLHEKAAGFVREWCDAVLFARFSESTTKLDNRVKGITDGRRTLHTAHTAAYDAKNRFNLPEELPLSWPELETAMKANAKETP